MDDSHRYDAIINLPHHVSPTHPQMGRMERAAQFSPFAALSGYEDAVQEAARRTDSQRELAEDEQERIRRGLHQAQMQLDAGLSPVVTITWFRPDARKRGGAYLTARATIKKIDPLAQAVILQSGAKIPFEAIAGIEAAQPSTPTQEA